MAVEARERPSGKNEFDDGRAEGLYAGLTRDKEILIDTVAEDNKREF